MSTLIESGWPRGWIPSDDELLTGESLGLLRMDNVTLEENGTLRVAKSSKIESISTQIDITSIFGAYVGGKKLRYIYRGIGATGSLNRNYNPDGVYNNLLTYDLSIFSALGSPPLRAAFLNALGHILIIAGSKKYKDRGDSGANVVFPLGIPVPTAPAVTANTAPSLNIDLGVAYTGIDSPSYFSAIGTTGATFNPNLTTLRGVIQSTSASTFDATNLGGSGHDTPDDVFYFNFSIADADLLSYVKIELYNESPPVSNYFWKEWDFNAINIEQVERRAAVGLGPFNVTSGVLTPVSMLRSEFNHVGSDATKDWTNIKAIRFTVGLLADSAITFDAYKVKGGDTGPLTGEQKYVVVEVRDTGQYLEFSPASTEVSINVTSQSTHLTRGSAVNAQANQIWWFRNNEKLGQYVAVHKESGSEGFTPAAFDDKLSDDDALISAAISPQYFLEPYRTALPDNIIGMIWFRDRVIYLTQGGFFPSYKLDPGSYDARFLYELASTTSEVCLFITKLDVGNFLIATTKDFYRVSGTFSEISEGDVTIQDVNIYSLGISDPAISQSFVEIEGAIIYMAASGIRSLSNITSTSLNGPLDLLFKGETRYGIESVKLLSANASIISCATSNNRMYWSLPYFDGINTNNRVFVFDIAKTYWRLLTEHNNASCMFREEDGTVIFAAIATDYIRSIENDTGAASINIRTQLNNNKSINNRKESSTLTLLINTGGMDFVLNVRTLLADGSFKSSVFTINTTSEVIKYIDIKGFLEPFISIAIELIGTSSTFSLSYYLLEYQPLAILIRRILGYASSERRHSITAWPFKVNTLGGTVTATVFGEDTFIDAQSFVGSDINVFLWESITSLFSKDWRIELFCDKEFEFYEFLEPKFSNESSIAIKRIVLPFTSFGKGGRKTIATWSLRVNTLDANLSIIVRADSVVFIEQLIDSNGDRITIEKWISNDPRLFRAWQIEVVTTNEFPFEFYEFLDPLITQETPSPTLRVILPGTNFGEDARKRLDHLPFRLNALNANLSMTMKIDDILQSPQLAAGQGDVIETYRWINLANVVGLDYELEIIFSDAVEFYEFLAPIINEKFPPKTYYAIINYTNFGRPVKKKLSVWPAAVNTLSGTIDMKVSADGSFVKTDNVTSNNEPRTLYWRNNQDFSAVDWKLELFAPAGMELYKIHDPELLQIFPMGKLIDQIGPLELNAKGIVFAFRLRLINEGTIIHYKVYDSDILSYENDINTAVGRDEVHEETLPKGINITVCRVILSSISVFYRFSLEFKVRLTGKETEEKYILVK